MKPRSSLHDSNLERKASCDEVETETFENATCNADVTTVDKCRPIALANNILNNSRSGGKDDPTAYVQQNTYSSAGTNQQQQQQPQQQRSIADEIQHQLEKIIERHQLDEHDQAIIREWQNVALVIDRCLFYLFTAIIVFTTLFLLVILPLTKRQIVVA